MDVFNNPILINIINWNFIEVSFISFSYINDFSFVLINVPSDFSIQMAMQCFGLKLPVDAESTEKLRVPFVCAGVLKDAATKIINTGTAK